MDSRAVVMIVMQLSWCSLLADNFLRSQLTRIAVRNESCTARFNEPSENAIFRTSAIMGLGTCQLQISYKVKLARSAYAVGGHHSFPTTCQRLSLAVRKFELSSPISRRVCVPSRLGSRQICVSRTLVRVLAKRYASTHKVPQRSR